MKYSTKGAKRWLKKQRMAKMYREFFADRENIEAVDDHGLMWAIEFYPRLCRDTVLGSRARSARGDA